VGLRDLQLSRLVQTMSDRVVNLRYCQVSLSQSIYCLPKQPPSERGSDRREYDSGLAKQFTLNRVVRGLASLRDPVHAGIGPTVRGRVQIKSAAETI